MNPPISPAHSGVDATAPDLATAQERRLASLFTGAPAPEGFDAERVRTLAESLKNKRSRAAKRAWPALARLLGERFNAEFDRHVAPLPLARERSALTDGLYLAAALEQQLDSASAAELAHVRLRFRLTSRGLVRRWFGVASAGPNRDAVGVCLFGRPLIRVSHP